MFGHNMVFSSLVLLVLASAFVLVLENLSVSFVHKWHRHRILHWDLANQAEQPHQVERAEIETWTL